MYQQILHHAYETFLYEDDVIDWKKIYPSILVTFSIISSYLAFIVNLHFLASILVIESGIGEMHDSISEI